MLQNEANRRFELLASVLCPAEGGIRPRRFAHFRIAIGVAVAEKVKAPHVEPGIAQRIAPGIAVETMRDRERGWKRRAVDVNDRSYFRRLTCRRRKMADLNRAFG